jgi:hypothetical protein
MRPHWQGLAIAFAAILLTACSGGGGGGSSSGSSSSGGNANVAPTANAGAAQTVNSGVSVTLNGSASSDSDGSVASYAWTQTAGSAVALSSATAAQPTFTAPTVATATTLTFSLVVTDNRGAASAAATANVTVNPAVAGNVNVTGRVRFARVNFSTTSPRPLNYGSPVLQPSRGVIVRALDATTQAVLASGVTDASGDFSLPVTSNTVINIQVVARLQRGGALPNWDIRVQDGTAGNSPYTFIDGTDFNSSAGAARAIDIPTGVDATGDATGTRASAPFAILDTLYTAVQTILGVAPSANFPALVIDWGTQTEGTFFTNAGVQHIALMSDLTEDTDEFDQHVIAHEFGHYIEFNFSRADNIGGSHGLGDRLDARVAFGEGFGYAFAAIVLNDPIARDSFVQPNGDLVSGGFNIETNPPGMGDPTGCWCSESSVWSILYDIHDSASDGNDTLSLGFAPIWNVLINPQRTTPAFTTIFSFTTALKTALPGNAAAIDALVGAQNIDTAAIDAFASTETHVPSGVPANAALPLFTTATIGGGPVVLRTVNDAGFTNKVGNHRFVRFDVASTRSVTITLTSSNPNNPDPDFRVWRAGTFVSDGTDPPPGAQTDTFTATPGTYLIDAYDCANGCNPTEPADGLGSGDWDLTVTIN